jgi:hypothetical protein
MDTNNEAEKRRTYMREYKRRKYAENTEQILAKNRAYYCRNTLNVPMEDFKKYDVLLPIVAKVRMGLNELRETSPQVFREIMDAYSTPN